MCKPSPIVKKYSYWTYRNYGDGIPYVKTSTNNLDKTRITFEHLYHNDGIKTMDLIQFLEEYKWLSSD